MPAPEGPNEQKWCPMCGKLLEPRAAVCPKCGRHLKTGRKTITEQESRRKAEMAGRAPLAIAVSATAAAVGGIVWGLLVVHLDVYLGYVAIAIGPLAGCGILFVARKRSPNLAFAAFGFAAMGLVIGKVVVISWGVPGIALEQARNGTGLEKVIVEDMLARGEIEPEVARIMLGDEESVEPGRMLEKARNAKVEIDRRASSITPAERRALERRVARVRAGRMSLGERITLQLSPWDVPWFLLSMWFAWKIAGIGAG